MKCDLSTIFNNPIVHSNSPEAALFLSVMPFNTLNPDVLEKIESLCTLGCKKVNNLIQRASQNIDIEELNEFSDVEKQQILQVLSDIMATYAETKD